MPERFWGVGTSAEALRTGRPTLVLPLAFDQFGTAHRLEQLGAAWRLERSELRATYLAAVLEDVLSSKVKDGLQPSQVILE